MVVNRGKLLVLAVVLITPSCSFLYDPAQYATVDAAMPTDIDARAPFEGDAFIGTGTDASLDAPVLESGPLDGGPDDASLDAHSSPDAYRMPTCPGAASLTLPGGALGNGLSYCAPPSDGVRFLARADAEEMLPVGEGGRYELGRLGNDVRVVQTTRDAIVDFEISREGEAIVVAWLDDSRAGVHRRSYTVEAAGLIAGTAETAMLDVSGAVAHDLSLEPGRVDSITVGYVTSTGTGAYAHCTPFAARCVSAPTYQVARPLGAVWVANGGPTVRGAFVAEMTPGSPMLFTEQVRPDVGSSATGATNLTVPDSIAELRSTAGSLVYTASNARPDENQFVVNPMTNLLTSLGGTRPRIARDRGEAYMLARAGFETGFDIHVQTASLTYAASAVSCSGGTCSSMGALERVVANGLPTIEDWSLLMDGRYRVAVFLVGNASGTEVAVAMWDGGGTSGATVTPMIVGSGRGSPIGMGRAIRAVMTRTETSLEVFVATLVELEGNDIVFLSGLRLLSCGL